MPLALVKFLEILGGILIGWSVNEYLNDLKGEVNEDGKCVRKYSFSQPTQCINCGVCESKMMGITNRLNMQGKFSSTPTNEEIMEAMDELSQVCPVGIVDSSIECTTG